MNELVYNKKSSKDTDVAKPEVKKQRLSNGQQRLAKANIKGMKKLESFFKRK